MASKILNTLSNFQLTNIRAFIEKATPLINTVASVTVERLSALSYQQIGGAFLIAGATTLLGYRYLNERDVIRRATPLIPEGEDRFQNALMLDVIRYIPSNEREDVIERATSLIREDMTGDQKACMLDVIRRIPSNEREDVIERAAPLIRENMDGYGNARILNVIRQIPPNDREDVIKRAAPLIREDMDGGQKADILDAIRNLPSAERTSRAVRALGQIELDFPNGQIADLDTYINRVIQLLQTPLNQDFLLIDQHGAMAAAAAAGHAEINVHAGQRDERVKKALILLRESQAMTDQAIASAAQECINYLKKNDCHKALHVLIGPNSPNDYGPFFVEFIVNSLSTSGEEIIGRLWSFIKALPEKEKEIVRDSFVAELNKCINEDGQRICNQGKVQHLFIAVLQGYLEGVEIDDSIKIPKKVSSSSENPVEQGESSEAAASRSVSVEHAINLFFATQKNREIDKLEELLAAAGAFCDESPLISREEFIKEIEDYAAQMDIR